MTATHAPATRNQAELPAVFHEVVGHSADVLYTIALYQEQGSLMDVERLEPTTPGQERARLRLLIGTPILPVGPVDGREQWEIGDYFIASLMVLRYLLYAGAATVAVWAFYHTYLGVAVTLICLVILFSLRKGSRSCRGIQVHCGGCKG